MLEIIFGWCHDFRIGEGSASTERGAGISRGEDIAIMLGPTAHTDTFTRDNLPPSNEWPTFLLDGFPYPDYLNAAVELTDRMVEKGFGDHIALIGNGRSRTYKELSDWTNRIAHVLIEDYGVRPGNRVLIRSPIVAP